MQLKQIFKNATLSNCYLISENYSDAKQVADEFYFQDYILFEKISNKNRFFWLVRQLLQRTKRLWSICVKCKTFVSTGGIVAVIPGIFCFFLKRRIVYVETIAKTTNLTVTGKIFYKIADEFFVQDAGLLQKFPKALYIGTLYRV